MTWLVATPTWAQDRHAPETDTAEVEAVAPDSVAPDSVAEEGLQVEEERASNESVESSTEAAPLAVGMSAPPSGDSEVKPSDAEVSLPIESEPLPGSVPDLRGAPRATQRDTIGLDPGAPQGVTIPGGITPSFGQRSVSSTDWVFDIHGFLMLPLRVGINSRENAGPGQKQTVLHTPPVVPGEYSTFEFTGVTPDPWAQLNFSYGNRDVTATVIIAARSIINANGYFDPADMLGINDAFITFHPKADGPTRFKVNVGAFANRYGNMGEYDLGQYGTSLIGRVSGIGATGTGEFLLAGLKTAFEVGVMGQLNKSPVGVEPAGWNGFTDPNAGTSFAVHGHLAVKPVESVELGAHAIYTFAQDDRATVGTQKDGSIGVYGLDARLTLKQFGHLYVGYAFTNASTARSVSSVIRVLNAPGGYGLMREYFGLESEGTGQLNTIGAQYDFSLGNALRAPKAFNGKAPDLVLSAFGIGAVVSSPDPAYDGVFKLKYGGAATYAFFPFLATGIRYDRVLSDTNDDSLTYAVVSPRLIFKSGWSSRDQVVLQYSGYFYGSNVAPVVGYPLGKDPTVRPDAHVVSMTASIWW